MVNIKNFDSSIPDDYYEKIQEEMIDPLYLYNALQDVDASDLVLNCTVNPNPRLFDCIESWYCWDVIKGCLYMAMSTKFRRQCTINGATEKCPNNKVRGHYHFQVCFINEHHTYDPEVVRDFINKFQGLLSKKVGNTKITKNLSLDKLNKEKSRRGIEIEENPEFTSYSEYMFKEIVDERDVYRTHIM